MLRRWPRHRNDCRTPLSLQRNSFVVPQRRSLWAGVGAFRVGRQALALALVGTALVGAALLLGGCGRSVPITESASNAVVVSVVDGDTVNVDIAGAQESVRLIGIDTPEKSGGYRDAECFGHEATVRTSDLLPPGTPIHLTLDQESRDRYDRLLAYVVRSDDGLFVNLDLVAGGYAAALRYEPNVFHSDQFAVAEQLARTQRLGLWATCGGPDTLIN